MTKLKYITYARSYFLFQSRATEIPKAPTYPSGTMLTLVLTVGEDCPHLEVAAGQSDDGGLVELGGDGRRQRQHLGQLVKLSVLFLPPRLCRVFAFFLHLLWGFHMNDCCTEVSPSIYSCNKYSCVTEWWGRAAVASIKSRSCCAQLELNQ